MEGDHHRLQEDASWCIPACVAMVEARRGVDVPQSTLASGWFGVSHGFSLDEAASYLGRATMRVDPLPASTYRWLQAQLIGGAWIIAYVFAAPLVRIQSERRGQLVSPHGTLSGHRHTVVMCGYGADTYRYLDPFYARDGQPYALGHEECVEVLVGNVIVVP